MDAPVPFLDTNLLIRHLLQDHAEHSPRATAFLGRIERGEVTVRTTDTVIFETVFTLQRGYRRSKAEIRAMLLPLIDLPGIVLPGKRHLARAFELYVDLNLPYGDAYHAMVMERLGLHEIATFDRDFDRVPFVRRLTLDGGDSR